MKRVGSTKLASTVLCDALTLVVLSALLLLAARPARAQNEVTLFNFDGTDGDGINASLIFDAAGNLYGTTQLGGTTTFCSGCGTVFELSPQPGGGWNETVLYNFCSLENCTDGGGPNFSNLIFDKAGNLYGTTGGGGAGGTVFELSPEGTSWNETVLYSFADFPFLPVNGLVMDQAGNLYGTVVGSDTIGAVFELSPSSGGWTEQIIYLLPLDGSLPPSPPG